MLPPPCRSPRTPEHRTLGHVLVFNLVSFMSSTAFRPVIYMICVNLVKSAFPARFVFTHLNLPSWDFKSVVTGRWYRQTKACMYRIKSSFKPPLDQSLLFRAYGMKRSRDRHHLSTAWVPAIVPHVKHVNEITYVNKLSMLKMLGKSRTGYSVQHMWNKFNIVSMLGYSETGYSVQKKCEIS